MAICCRGDGTEAGGCGAVSVCAGVAARAAATGRRRAESRLPGVAIECLSVVCGLWSVVGSDEQVGVVVGC